jgi:ribosomal protein S4E
VPIAGKDATTIPSKITSKSAVKGKKFQLGFHNGETLLVKEAKYKVGDTLFLTIEKKEDGHAALDTGAFVIITAGKHVGKTGVIEKITEGLATIKGDDVFETEKAKPLRSRREEITD